MNHAPLISRWKRCQELAKKLGMTVSTNGETLAAAGTPTGFKSYYSCATIDELLGYLEGVTDAKEKLQKTTT